MNPLGVPYSLSKFIGFFNYFDIYGLTFFNPYECSSTFIQSGNFPEFVPAKRALHATRVIYFDVIITWA